MKNFALILVGGVAGYFLNSKTGKNLCNWIYSKGKNKVNDLVNKIDEVTTPEITETPSPEESK